MGGTVNRIHNTVDGVAQDLGATITTIANTVDGLRHDTSETINNVASECVESLHIITQRADQTTFLLTNSVLALAAAIALGILLHLTHFSPFLRAIIWTMYAGLCLHMVLTYFRYSRSQMPLFLQEQSLPLQQQSPQLAIQYQNQNLETTIAQSEIPTVVSLVGFKLIEEDMNIVISQAINNQQCTILRFKSNNITSTVASVLADALRNNTTLEQLSLWDNQVGDIGVIVLSDALRNNSSALKRLDLSQNGITDEGAEYLAQMLKINKILIYLTLSNNEISNQGLQSLASALQNDNNTLQRLSLTGNRLVDDSCVDSLINMFKKNQSLERLWINNCNLSKSGKDKLQKALRSKEDFELKT